MKDSGIIGRRGVLGHGLAALAVAAAGPAFAQQLRPKARPIARDEGAGGVAAIIAAAKLGGTVGYAVADRATGQVLASMNGDMPMPPASVTKALTALYAADRLGPAHRFATQLMARGPITGGVLQGDLVLACGGDPSLDTDRLGDMARALADTGLRRVTGQFFIWGGALPLIDRIDADQPDYVGYNPTISGAMLNFNRAQFVWGGQKGAMVLAMNAEGARFNPAVHAIEVVSAPREAPLFTYEARTPRERWSVAAPALRKSGSRWLPVRAPIAYMGDVFATLCAAQGIDLPQAREAPDLPKDAQILVQDQKDAQILVQDQSAPLDEVMRGMLRYSTNLTAESLGLAASGAADLRSSASAMADWAAAHYGIAARFVDHSGLGAASQCSPKDMLRIMLGARGLDILLRERRIDAAGREAKDGALRILAKSGTLNFTSNLAGYVTAPSGRSLAFAIFAADSPRRAALPVEHREEPAGGAAWNKRARAMQRQIIATWANLWAT